MQDKHAVHQHLRRVVDRSQDAVVYSTIRFTLDSGVDVVDFLSDDLVFIVTAALVFPAGLLGC